MEKRELNGIVIYDEMSEEDQVNWFDFKKTKFLHNIDTFYYSVKLYNDFTPDTVDQNVIAFRKKFDMLKQKQGYEDSMSFYVDGVGNLNLVPFHYGKFYNICLEFPDYFHIFVANWVPRAAGDTESVTCEIIVQIRSYMLWMYGVHESFRKSMEYVQAFCDMHKLQIAFVQENRVDYCFHSNYLSNPQQFFSTENFYKMRVDRWSDAYHHTTKVGSDGYEVDYISVGSRGGKCFIRIYLKSKEVVEQGYKAFFFKVWMLHGLISRYDLYCYEKAYVQKSWNYMTIARFEFYLEYGSNHLAKETCRKYIQQYSESRKITDQMLRFADQITPKVHLIINVEFQTLRKGSKSYDLLPVKDNSSKGVCKRVYDYLDNRQLIIRYLTHDIFRLVEIDDDDTNKSRRDYCGFWKALRSAKLVDMHKFPDGIKLTRIYNRKLNKDLVKRQLLNKTVVYGFYNRGMNQDNVMRDCMQALLEMNDNDIVNAMRYKQKKSLKFNQDELQGMCEDNTALHKFMLLDSESGVIYDEDTILFLQKQGGE